MQNYGKSFRTIPTLIKRLEFAPKVPFERLAAYGFGGKEFFVRILQSENLPVSP